MWVGGSIYCGGRAGSMLHSTLVWLDREVRQPREGTAFDLYFASPAKAAYLWVCRRREESVGVLAGVSRARAREKEE